MGSSSPPRRERSEEQDLLLMSFLDVLRSSASIAIPIPTLQGAITHYLSTLDGSDLLSFTSAIITSPKLWTEAVVPRKGVREAIRLSIPAKVSAITKEYGGRYFSKTREARAARNWLRDVVGAVLGREDGPARFEVLVGLLQGVGEVERSDWGAQRVRLEEEVVLALAKRLADPEEVDSDLLCSVVPYLDERRALALDLAVRSLFDFIGAPLLTPSQTVLSRLNAQMASCLSRTDGTRTVDSPTFESRSEEASSIARSLGRIFVVLDHGGPSSRHHAWEAMRQFCVSMRSERCHSASHSSPSSSTDDQWEISKLSLFAFLVPATSMVDVMLEDHPPTLSPYPDSDVDPMATLAIGILHTLYSHADLVDTASGGLEGYDKVFDGCLDVLVTRGGTAGARILFQSFGRRDRVSPGEAAFSLIVGQQLINHLDGETVTRCLMPLASRVHQPEHRASFEAAHAFLLALLQAASTSLDSRQAHTALFDELCPFYARLLITQASLGDLSSDQFRSAFPLLVEAASRRNQEITQACFRLLEDATSRTADPSWQQTLLLTAISCSPHCIAEDLQGHLERIAHQISEQTAELSSQRLAAVAAAFKMVLEELPDDRKEIGVNWWMRWRGELEGRRPGGGGVRARL